MSECYFRCAQNPFYIIHCLSLLSMYLCALHSKLQRHTRKLLALSDVKALISAQSSDGKYYRCYWLRKWDWARCFILFRHLFFLFYFFFFIFGWYIHWFIWLCCFYFNPVTTNTISVVTITPWSNHSIWRRRRRRRAKSARPCRFQNSDHSICYGLKSVQNKMPIILMCPSHALWAVLNVSYTYYQNWFLFFILFILSFMFCYYKLKLRRTDLIEITLPHR